MAPISAARGLSPPARRWSGWRQPEAEIGQPLASQLRGLARTRPCNRSSPEHRKSAAPKSQGQVPGETLAVFTRRQRCSLQQTPHAATATACRAHAHSAGRRDLRGLPDRHRWCSSGCALQTPLVLPTTAAFVPSNEQTFLCTGAGVNGMNSASSGQGPHADATKGRLPNSFSRSAIQAKKPERAVHDIRCELDHRDDHHAPAGPVPDRCESHGSAHWFRPKAIAAGIRRSTAADLLLERRIRPQP